MERFTGGKLEDIGLESNCAQYRNCADLERGLLMPSEVDIARVAVKISRLTDEQLRWFIAQMRHLGFSPCGEMCLDPDQQSK